MINLYSDSRCPFSHSARLVLSTKDMDYKIIDATINGQRQDLMVLNPYSETPVLVDDIDKNNKKRDLVLSDPTIICEYIDERFPHPQLMPIEPSEKARLRMLMRHCDREIFSHVRTVEKHLKTKDSKLKKELDTAKKAISAGLDSISSLFVASKKSEHLFGNTFTLLDAAVLPLIWRLKYYNIDTKQNWTGMLKYAEKFFETPEFIASLTPAERGMR